MAAFEGLDVEAVQAQGAHLKAQASHLDGIIHAVSALVSNADAVWAGHDSTVFAGAWHQQHRPALVAASAAVAGLGQSAINNATDQATTSASSGSGLAASVAPGSSWQGGKDAGIAALDALGVYGAATTLLPNLMSKFPGIAGKLDVAGHIVDDANLGVDGYRLGQDVAEGHYVQAAGEGYDAVADGLKTAHTPVPYLIGVNMSVWKSVYQDSQQVDWSMPMPNPLSGSNFKDIYVSGAWYGLKTGVGQILGDL